MALTYTQRSTPTDVSHTWRGICWSEDLQLFCAVGSIVVAGTATGTSRIMTSPDGITWTQRAADVSAANTFQNVIWSPTLGLFICVKVSGTDRVITSPDGITWTSRPIPGANIWNDVAWSEELGIAVAVASSGTNRAMSSTNGTTWTARAITSGSWSSVAWCPGFNGGAGFFVAVTVTGSDTATSPDGINWTFRADKFGTQSGTGSRCLAYSPSLNRLICVMGNNDNPLWTTDDGITWTQRSMPTTGTNRPVWFGACRSEEMSLFIVVGRDGLTNNNQVAHSADGISWMEEAPGVATVQPWRNVAASPFLGYAVAIDDGTDNDGLNAMTIEAGATPPSITSVTPNSGYTRGGALSTNPTITIAGTDFVNGLEVTFGGVSATSIVVTGSTQITCVYPPHAAGLVALRVTNPDALFDEADFTYIAPFIAAVTPNHGPATGGTPVVITGDGFVANSEITFDGLPALDIVFVDPQEYTCTTPAHPIPGAVKVIILEP